MTPTSQPTLRAALTQLATAERRSHLALWTLVHTLALLRLTSAIAFIATITAHVANPL